MLDGFNAAYATDKTYRIAHHGERIIPPSGGGGEAYSLAIAGPSRKIFEKNGVKITAFTVEHTPIEPAVGYRFDYKGRSICVSGDTVRSSNLERACKGVDILVHEALQPALVREIATALEAHGNKNAAKIMYDITDYHTSPEDAADSAQKTGAKLLLLTHLLPPLPSAFLYPAFLGKAGQRYEGEIIVGEDGMIFSLPADSSAIERSNQL